MVSAQASGSRVEDVSQRTESTRTFANPDGTWSTELNTGPVRVQREDGAWADIDTTLVPDGSGAWVPRAAAAEMSFSDGGAEPFATMAPTEESSFGLAWPQALPEPVVDGATLTYTGVVPNGDLVVEALPAGFSHEIVLHEAPAAPLDVEIPLQLDGLELVEEPTGTLSVVTEAGKQVAMAPAPLMWDDQTTDAGDPANVALLDTTVDTTGADAQLVLSPDTQMLQDPDTQYPVVIDPTFTKAPFRDTWIQNSGPAGSQVESTELRAGTPDAGAHKARSFLDFATGDLNGKTILSATLKARNYYSSTCNTANIRVQALSENWNKDLISWDTQPEVHNAVNDPYDDFAQAYGATGCPDPNWATWNVTDIVKRWTSGSWDRYGFRLKAVDETNSNSWRKYRSANFDDPSMLPTLVVTYNNRPNTAGAPSVSPGNAGYATTTTPTLKTTLTDPDGGELRAKFTIETAAGSEVWTGYSCTAQELDEEQCTGSGGKASKMVPASANLAPGATYIVEAWAQDATGDLSKTASAPTTFKVDTSVPGVAITADAFTNNTWEPTAPASNTFTLAGAADTSSFEVLMDSTSITVPANASGDGTLEWNVDSGWHTLSVIPHDRAGNAPTTVTTFSFGVKKPDFAAPRSGKGSLGVFRLQPRAPGGASAMTLRWRQHGTADWFQASGVTTAAGAVWSGSTTNSGSLSTPGTLLWDASEQTDPNTGQKLTAPRLLELQACFTYTAETACSDPLQVQLDDGFGPQYPTTDFGPATVALASGALTLSATDARTGSVALGRTWSTSRAEYLLDGPFGHGWNSSALGSGASSASIVDQRASDGTLTVSYPGERSEIFVRKAASSSIYVPVDPTNTFMELALDTDVAPAKLTLKQDVDTANPTVTTWHRDQTSEEWVLDTVDAPGGAHDIIVSSTGARLDWIAQSADASAASCTATIQSEGCRGLMVNYDDNDHIVSVVRKVHPTGSQFTQSTLVATYSYTGDLLTEACGADPDGAGVSVPLCISYQYESVGGIPRLTAVTPPAQTKWRFVYDGAGRAAEARRALTSSAEDAVWAIDYALPLTAPALPDMSAAAIAQWGQSVVPTRVLALYSPQANGTPSIADPRQAQLYYLEADGSVTNSAIHGPSEWLVETTWVDDFGNIVQTLDGQAWSTVQDATPADRLSMARDASTFTVYNDAGDRVEDEFGPVITATLNDGTVGPFREHTTYVYDDEQPALGGPKPSGNSGPHDLVVEERHAAAEPDMNGIDHDAVVTRYEYDPVVAGDGNGWTLGVPTKSKTQIGETWSTQITRYDSDGNLIEIRQPGGASTPSGEGSDAHSSSITYYTRGEHSRDADCGNKPGWEGLVCKAQPAGQPQAPTMPVVWNRSYTSDLQPEVVQETSGHTVRTTTTTYDNLGRVTSTDKVITGGDSRDSALPERTLVYNAQGQVVETHAGAATITTRYDNWGRPVEYVDANGNRSLTTYNSAGAVATFHDGVNTYTYNYTESGWLQDVAAGGGAGSFGYRYGSAGQIDSVTYPNGLVAEYRYNEIGVPTGLTYRQSGNDLLTFEADVDVFGRSTTNASTASEQNYTYDPLGRLIRVQDSREGGCTTRKYGYDEASNRTMLASYAPTAAGSCQEDLVSTSRAMDYDSASRLRSDGYTYDSLGRTRTQSASNATAEVRNGELTATYYADDMVASLSVVGEDDRGELTRLETTYEVDPTSRVSEITNTADGEETSRTRYIYANSSDVPSVVETSADSGATWNPTRYVSMPGLRTVASITNGATSLYLVNLHGDIVATQQNTGGNATIDEYMESDEYGVAGGPPAPGGADRYGWLGSYQRSTDAPAGLMLMGVRVYDPQTARFLTPDPMPGGNDNLYVYPSDAINYVDVSGAWHWTRYRLKRHWGHREAKLKAARFRSSAMTLDFFEVILGKVPGWLGAAAGLLAKWGSGVNGEVAREIDFHNQFGDGVIFKLGIQESDRSLLGIHAYRLAWDVKTWFRS